MKILRWLSAYFAVIGMIVASVPMCALGSESDLSPKTKEFLRALKEGGEKETIAEYYHRLGGYLPKEVNMDLAPHLKLKGHLPAPQITINGDEVTFKQDAYELRMKIESTEKGNVITMNGRKLSPEDFSTVDKYLAKLGKILQEDFGGKKESKKHALLPWRLLIQEAHADIDWMPLLLGAGIGGLGGYFFGGTTGALIGAVAGAAVGYFFFGNKCPSTPQCCWAGGNIYQSGCCSSLKMTEVLANFCTTTTTTTTTGTPVPPPLASPPDAGALRGTR